VRSARSAVIVALGFFALVAQTLLFRAFLAAFEGNELAVGGFYGSWLLWIALGALLGRLDSRLHARLAARFELATLLYIPAFVLQHWVIADARALAGVRPYELFPLGAMLAVSLLANAPISLLTGFFFALACRWSSGEHDVPPARVYILEALGSGAGGVAVTLLLAAGVPPEQAFVVAALALAGPAAFVSLARVGRGRRLRRILLAVSPAVTATAVLLVLMGGRWAELGDRSAWRQLLPKDEDAYRGSFSTAQAEYLYGEREGEFIVVSWGGASETIPDTEHASEVVAVTLAENPKAREVLVVGPGSLSICARFLKLPQIERVTWLHPDPDYPAELLSVLPEGLWPAGCAGASRGGPDRPAAGRFDVPGSDVREFVRRTPARYDVAVLNLPDATTLALNRYFTREFFASLKGVLAERGVLALRVSGAANYLGGELAYLGGSALVTLESVFAHVVLKPGDESWLIASGWEGLSASPAVLRDRFAGIEGAGAVYPPDGIFSLYLPDRMEFQMGQYRRIAAEAARDVLLNTDASPKGLLYGLLLALRRAGERAPAGLLPVLLNAGPWIAACAVLVYGLMRLAYLLAGRRRRKGPDGRADGDAAQAGGRGGLFDGYFLVLSTGLAGMSLSIALMFTYQSRFGSLFLYVGLIASLFMLGSSGGGFLGERVLVRRGAEPAYLLPACLAAQLALILAVYLLPAETPAACYFLLFAVCGALMGACFPIAAFRAKAARRTAAMSGSTLETLDHLGGAAGAVLTGVVMLPVFGGQATLAILAALVAVNLVPVLAPDRRGRPVGGQGADRFDAVARAAAWAMFGTGAFLLIASRIAASASAEKEGRPLLAAARTMTGRGDLAEERARLPDGTVITYFTVPDRSGGVSAAARPGVDGYVFDSGRLAGAVQGYGGPIALAVYTDREGALRDFRLIRSGETPVYVARLLEWKHVLAGRNVFAAGSLAGVDAASGATMTSRAVLVALEGAGCAFAKHVLGIAAGGPAAAGSRWLPDRDFALLALLLLGAVAMRRVPRATPRRIFLLASLLVAGVLLNMQYSTHQVFSLLGLDPAGGGLTGPFFLVFVVPAAVLLFGNVYCGYACPFGALSELVGDLRPAGLATDPGKGVWRYGRAVKYALLFLLVVLFAVTGERDVLSSDPLVAFFGLAGGWAVTAMALAALAASFVFRRFWCRNLCPAGAFLSLLNGVRLLRRLVPPARPGRCDMGVRNASELDCIYCDRCRHENDAGTAPASPAPSGAPAESRRASAERARVVAFVLTVLGFAAAFAGVTLAHDRKADRPGSFDSIRGQAGPGSAEAALPAARAAGKARDLDASKVRSLLRQGYLSDHEAEFYGKIEAPAEEGHEPARDPNP